MRRITHLFALCDALAQRISRPDNDGIDQNLKQILVRRPYNSRFRGHPDDKEARDQANFNVGFRQLSVGYHLLLEAILVAGRLCLETLWHGYSNSRSMNNSNLTILSLC